MSERGGPPRERPLLHVFDGSPIELRGRSSQLRMAGLDASWEITGHTSRNALLRSLEGDVRRRPRRQSVTLIDARVETGDIDQIGFRICETIMRHELLWKSTRPIIWVDTLSDANSSFARRGGALAIVDDDWVDRTDAAELDEALQWARGQEPHPLGRGSAGSLRVISDRSVDPEAEAAERDELFRRRFGRPPGELDFTILWGMADAVELSFLYWYCEAEGIASERQAQRACERLQEAMRPEREHLDRPEPTNAEIARRFLSEVVPPSPDPLADIAWPSIEHVEQVYFAPELRELAYLEPGSEPLLESFFASHSPAGSKTRERYEAIVAASESAAAGAGIGAHKARRQIQRSCHALDDARLDALGADGALPPHHLGASDS